MASEHTLTLTDAEFEQVVLKSDKPVRLIFGRNGAAHAA